MKRDLYFISMEIINNVETEYLIDASLESLHDESCVWISQIDFWNEEISFFYKLIHLKERRPSLPGAELASLDKQLIKLEENLGQVKSKVQHQERMLSVAIRNIPMEEEQEYRERHRNLLMEMHSTRDLIRAFKRDAFFLVSSSSPNGCL